MIGLAIILAILAVVFAFGIGVNIGRKQGARGIPPEWP